MKTFTLLFTIIVASTVFVSCQKEFKEDGIPALPGNSSGKIKTYTEDISVLGVHTVTTLNLNYDANGRLISMISLVNGGVKYLFKYNAANSYTLDFYKANVINLHQVVFLTNFSLIDSTVQYNRSNKLFMTEKYIYNSAKQLMQLKKYDYSTAVPLLSETFNYHYDINGDMAKVTASKYDITYDYYPNITAKWVGVSLPYMPTVKNFIKTTTMSAGGLSQVFSHAYTFDSNNRLSTEKTSFPGSNDFVLKTYTYF